MSFASVSGVSLAPVAQARLVRQTAPSGQDVELLEVLVDEVDGETWLRFRFLAPGIGKEAGDLTFEETVQDFEFLCNEIALPYMDRFSLSAQIIVISLLDRPVDFGSPDPDATQYFETFRVAGRVCEPEGIW